eukprot:TRINITY_DN4317_c0_g1_i1.p1 TRINITY_DN4317_c0_g1~~TRINITY_DN4317_c0_g1_i1.p1  ORF type:complete len:136 (+),score=29.90 TRINITY_DN4317_c0_g1_i1:48-455(+)
MYGRGSGKLGKKQKGRKKADFSQFRDPNGVMVDPRGLQAWDAQGGDDESLEPLSPPQYDDAGSPTDGGSRYFNPQEGNQFLAERYQDAISNAVIETYSQAKRDSPAANSLDFAATLQALLAVCSPAQDDALEDNE